MRGRWERPPYPLTAARSTQQNRAIGYQASQEQLCLLPGWRWWGLGLLNWTIGYGLGLRYFRALWWVLALTLLGSVLLLVSHQGPDRLSAKVLFSLDRLVPRLVELDKSHDEVEVGLKGWVRRYFYLHKIVGYVLAGFLLAGLAGLTQE